MHRNQIFVSYSHRDRDWFERFHDRLQTLSEVSVDIWADTRLAGGDEWWEEIDRAIQGAGIAVLMLSPDFLASRFVRGYEVPRILERYLLEGLRIYPFLVRDCGFTEVAWLRRLQVKPLYLGAVAALPPDRVEEVLDRAVGELRGLLTEPIVPGLPAPGQLILPTVEHRPPLLIGLRVFEDDPFRLDFVMDSGDRPPAPTRIRAVAHELVCHFLTCLALPESALWVNLSPEEPGRVSDPVLTKTRTGQILIRQDYILKQFSSSLLFPDSETGRGYWDAVHAAVDGEDRVDLCSKIWIVPEIAEVWDRDGLCLITSARLGVAIAEDRKALRSFLSGSANEERGSAADALVQANGGAAKRVLVEVANEVNGGFAFAALRQIYYSLVLARWFKVVMSRSALAEGYVDRKRVAGLESEDDAYGSRVYDQYMAAYGKGVFHFIGEYCVPGSQEPVPRKYFSGGFLARAIEDRLERSAEGAVLAGSPLPTSSQWYAVRVRLLPAATGGSDSTDTRGFEDPVGGVDLSRLDLRFRTGSGDTTLSPEAIAAFFAGAEAGLIPVIEAIRPIESIGEL